MNIKGEFVLRQVAGETILIPVNNTALSMNGMAVLNEVGAFLWERLPQAENADALVSAILAEYDVDEETARADVNEFLNQLKAYHIL